MGEREERGTHSNIKEWNGGITLGERREERRNNNRRKER